MISLLLKFRDGKLQRRYYNHVTHRLLRTIFLVHLFIIADFMFFSIYLPFCAIGFKGLYCLSDRNNVPYSILNAIWLIVFCATSFFLRFKRKTYSDYPLLVSYFLLLIASSDHFNTHDLSPAFGHMFSILNLLFMTVYRGFHIKVLHILGNMAYYLGFYISYFDLDKKDLIFIQLIVFSLLLVMVLYTKEKTEMMLFLKNCSFEKEKKGINDMFEILPDGLLIFSKSMNLIFANESIKTLYEETDLEKLGNKFLKETSKKPLPVTEMNQPVSNSEVSELNNSNPGNKTLKKSGPEGLIPLGSIILDFVQKISGTPKATCLSFKETTTVPGSSSRNTKCSFRLDPAKSLATPRLDTFNADYQSSTLQIKILSIKYSNNDCVLIMVNDLTESLKLRALEEANEYKNNLFASFTHEFKTPLNCLFAMLQNLAVNARLTEEVKNEVVKPAQYNWEILNNLVNAISDYSLLSLGKLKLERRLLSLRDFFEKSLECLRYQAMKKGIAVSLEIQKGIPDDLKTDPRRLQQILFQLYSNAIKFTYSGKIQVKVKFDRFNRPFGIKVSVKDSGIGIAEKDRARLESSLSEANVFISKSKASHHSIGASLGLTVSQQIAKMLGFPHGKGIFFKSAPGSGSEFSFVIRNTFNDHSRELASKRRSCSNYTLKDAYSPSFEESESPILRTAFIKSGKTKTGSNESLPKEFEFTSTCNFSRKYGFVEGTNLLSYDSQDHIAKKLPSDGTLDRLPVIMPEQAGVVCEHEPILIVDDDEFNLLALSSILSVKKLRSLPARNGKIALEIIEKELERRKNCGCKTFKLIFMDLNMPVMNGIEAAAEIKKMKERGVLWDVPIIAFTAFEMEIEKSECFKAGMTEYMTKPVDIVRLGALLDRFIFKKP